MMALAFLATMYSVSAQAQSSDLLTAAQTGVAEKLAGASTILFAAIGITVAFAVYSVIKRALSR